MDTTEQLRNELVAYVRKKFYTRRSIVETADDIVNQAFLNVMGAKGYTEEHCNFGYLSVACIRVAYKLFHRNDEDDRMKVSLDTGMPLIGEDCFIDDILQNDDTAAVLESLQALKQMERIIVTERYYGDYSFKEISERHGINLSTIRSHHRRALMKLKPLLLINLGRNRNG